LKLAIVTVTYTLVRFYGPRVYTRVYTRTCISQWKWCGDVAMWRCGDNQIAESVTCLTR